MVSQGGQPAVYLKVWYKGQVSVNVVGYWERGFREPLWLMTNLAPEQALFLYLQRMKIEESFRDMKTLMGMQRAMNEL